MLFRNHCWQILNQHIRVYMPFADCTLLSSRGGTSARHLEKIPKKSRFFLGSVPKLDSIVKMSTKSMVNGDCDPLDKNKITSTANITGDLCNCIQFACLLSLQPGPAANIQISVLLLQPGEQRESASFLDQQPEWNSIFCAFQFSFHHRKALSIGLFITEITLI